MLGSPIAAALISAILLGVVAVPVLLILIAMRGGPHMPRIVALVSYAAMVVVGGLTVLTTIALMTGTAVKVTVPIAPIKPYLPPGVTLEHATPATIEGGGMDQATLLVSGLPLNTRLVILAAMLLAAATAIAVCVVVIRLARSVASGNPFALGTQALIATGWILLIGGVLASLTGQIGDIMACYDIFEYTGGNAPESWNPAGAFAGPGWPEPAGFRLDIPWWPVGGALMLALIAGVFRYGEQLQRDSEGLV